MYFTQFQDFVFSLPPTYPSTTPYIVTFHLISGDLRGDLRGGNDKSKLLENAM